MIIKFKTKSDAVHCQKKLAYFIGIRADVVMGPDRRFALAVFHGEDFVGFYGEAGLLDNTITATLK